MLVELSLVPLGRGQHLCRGLGEILNIIDESGLRYPLAPSGTCVEGEWDEAQAATG